MEAARSCSLPAASMSTPTGALSSSRFRPPGTVSGAQEIFFMVIPYRKYFFILYIIGNHPIIKNYLGPGDIPGGRNRARRCPGVRSFTVWLMGDDGGRGPLAEVLAESDGPTGLGHQPLTVRVAGLANGPGPPGG
jgi:hypothetical protein